MKKVVIICPPSLPVPAVKGGAIEQLVTILIDQNEIYKQSDLEVFSVCDKEAMQESSKYTASKLHYISFNKFHYRLCRKILRTVQSKIGYKYVISDLYYRKVLKKCKKINPDIIIFEAGRIREMAKFSKYFGSQKMYVHIHHNLIAEKGESGIFDNSIAVSNFVNNTWDAYLDKTTKNKMVLYNAIDEEKFKNTITKEERKLLRGKLGVKQKDFLLIYCGRIQPIKGVLELAKAVVQCKEASIKLMIIGGVNFNNSDSSDYLTSLQEIVKANPDRLIYLGYINNDELYKYYRISDLQVIPSLCEEAAGLVAIEGQMCGLPQIITNSGGMIEYVSDSSCVKVERNENIVQVLATAILDLYNKPALRSELKKEALINANKFSSKRYYIDFIKLFEEV